jgi:hypothetical protein
MATHFKVAALFSGACPTGFFLYTPSFCLFCESFGLQVSCWSPPPETILDRVRAVPVLFPTSSQCLEHSGILKYVWKWCCWKFKPISSLRKEGKMRQNINIP